jgi:hypothetical protein
MARQVRDIGRAPDLDRLLRRCARRYRRDFSDAGFGWGDSACTVAPPPAPPPAPPSASRFTP